MAVTSRVLAQTFSLFFVMMSIACTVDNSAETLNAFQNCNPTADQITSFHTDVFQTDLQSCVSCHSTEAPSEASPGVDGPPFLVNPASTEEEQRANFCSVYLRGQESPSVVIFNYPQSDTHGATGAEISFGASSLQNIRTFIETVTLEETTAEE